MIGSHRASPYGRIGSSEPGVGGSNPSGRANGNSRALGRLSLAARPICGRGAELADLRTPDVRREGNRE